MVSNRLDYVALVPTSLSPLKSRFRYYTALLLKAFEREEDLPGNGSLKSKSLRSGTIHGKP